MSKRFDQSGGTEAVVTDIPTCDLCKAFQGINDTAAVYDGKTTRGPWAYMCESHFQQYGIGLGQGRGQKLFTEDI